MTSRDDVSVLWFLSPRIILVDDPATEITIQDLHDTLRDIEDEPENMVYPDLIATAGKEALGGGVSVGLTSTLKNAYVAFESRTFPLTSGRTATANDTDGIILTDSDGYFDGYGIYPGCTIFNHSTGDMATVMKVLSATQLRHFALSGGVGGEWTIGDIYSVYPNIQCSISGGNLVAVDEVGADISPILPTANVQIVRTASSSATSTDIEAIQYSSYQNAVWVRPSSAQEGTSYPSGTREFPVNNVLDAAAIAKSKGFSALQILESMTIDSGSDLRNFTLIGVSRVDTMLVIDPSAQVDNAGFKNCNITGTLDGGARIEDCSVGDLNYVNGQIRSSGLYGEIFLAGNDEAVLVNCYTIDQDSPPIIDMGGSGQDLAVPNYSGFITIKNLTSDTEEIGVGLNAGLVMLDATITAGSIIIGGTGLLIDNSTGTALVNSDGLLNKDNIASAMLDTSLIPYTTKDTVAHSLRSSNFQNKVTVDAIDGYAGTDYPLGTISSPVSNIVDAETIAIVNGFDIIHIIGDYNFTSAESVSLLTFVGEGKQSSTFTFNAGTILPFCRSESAKTEGPVTGMVGFKDCHLNGIISPGIVPSSNTVIVENCLIQGTITLPSNFTGELIVLDCWMLPTGAVPPAFDFGDGAFSVQVRNLSGFVSILNCTEPNDVRIFFNSGGIRLDSTVTAGNFTLTGVGTLVNESTSTTSLDISALIHDSIIATAVWDENVSEHIITGTAGETLRQSAFQGSVWIDTNPGRGSPGISFPIGTPFSPVDNISDAYQIASNTNLYSFGLNGEISLENNMQGFTFVGQGSLLNDTINLNGYSITDSRFDKVKVVGEMSGSNPQWTDCILSNVSNASGVAVNSGIDGTLTLGLPGAVFSGKNLSFASNPTTIDVVGAGRIVQFSGEGIVEIDNMATGAPFPSILQAGLQSGEMTLNASCAGGFASLDGSFIAIDNSTGTVVTDRSMSKFTIADQTWDELLVDHDGYATAGAAQISSVYDNRVCLDVTSGISGIGYPAGTHNYPVDNWVDAELIAIERGFNKICVLAPITFSSTDNIDDYIFDGVNVIDTVITIDNGCSTQNTTFMDAVVEGTLDGKVFIRHCQVYELINFKGYAFDSLFIDDIAIEASTKTSGMFNCSGGKTGGNPLEINIGSNGLAIFGWKGPVKFVGKTGTDLTYVELMSGQVKIDSSCVAGEITLKGIGRLSLDESGAGCTINTTDLINVDTIADQVWEEAIIEHDAYGTFGRALGFTVAAETIATGGSPTIMFTGRIEPDNYWNDHQVVIYDRSNGQKVIRNIEDYAQANGAITFNTPLPFTPVTNDPVMILASSSAASATIDAASIADAVWDEPKADHTDTDTFGDLQNTSISFDGYLSVDVDPELIADAVWEESTADHNTENTFGWLMKEIADGYTSSQPPDAPTNTNVTVTRGNYANVITTGAGPGSIRYIPKGLTGAASQTNKLTISVQKREIKISLDGRQNYITFPVGIHTLSIGWIGQIFISGAGTWEIMASFN